MKLSDPGLRERVLKIQAHPWYYAEGSEDVVFELCDLVIEALDRLESQQVGDHEAASWKPTIRGQLINAKTLVERALDHHERSAEPETFRGQRYNRRDQAASMVGDAIKSLATVGYLMALEALKETNDA
jgi:hypothetical protein